MRKIIVVISLVGYIDVCRLNRRDRIIYFCLFAVPFQSTSKITALRQKASNVQPKLFDIDGMHVIHIMNYEKSMCINCAPKRCFLIVCL